jgi:hypothetical protein
MEEWDNILSRVNMEGDAPEKDINSSRNPPKYV